MGRRERMARVRVDDETWAAFRVGSGARPVAEVLGRLVAQEVARRRRAQAGDGAEAAHAVADARQLAAELEALAARIEAD